MEKIDRLGWASGLSFCAYGARIGIRVNEAWVVERLPRYLPPGSEPSSSGIVDILYSLWIGGVSERPGVRNYHLVYAGARRVVRSLDLDEALGQLESVLHFGVALMARRKLFVHAGVVGWRGRTIVIPGRSLSGKTSLVVALLRAGATYYSDEYAVFDGEGLVHPFPKPLSLRRGDAGPPERCPVEALGGRPGTKPIPMGLVALSVYQAGARWRPRTLSRGRGVLSLLDNTVLARARPKEALAILERAVEGTSILKSKRGEACDVVESLLSHRMA
jgi:hypothetical protein